MSRGAGWLLAALTVLVATSGGAHATEGEPDGALPDRVYEAPEHAAELAEEDPFEPVALLLNGVNDRALAVGADTGSYRYVAFEWLENSLNRDDGRFALSADGSQLGWVQPEGPVVVRVWDAASGTIFVHDVPEVSIQSQPVMAMSPDGSAIAMQLADLEDGAYQKTTEVMDAETGELTRVRDCPRPLGWTQPGELLCEVGGRLAAVPVDGSAPVRMGPLAGATWPFLLSPDGTRATARLGPELDPVVLDLDSGTREPLPLDGDPAAGVLGWADDGTVVVVRPEAGLVTVDLAGGATETVVEIPATIAGAPGLSAPTGLLTEPTYAASEPDWPLHPRWIIIGVILAVLVAIAAAVLLMDLAGRLRRPRRPAPTR